MNLLVLSGRVASDVTMRYTKKGKPVASFLLAVRKSYTKDADGNYPTSFVYIDAWNKLAETCEQNLMKGSQIMMRGHVTDNQYTDKEGKQQYGIKLVADNIEFVGNKKQGATAGDYSDEDDIPIDDIPM